jgi:hypothetical protein
MLKCPLCSFQNEDGALFCEQCKTDLASVTPSQPPAVTASGIMAVATAEPAPDLPPPVVAQAGVESVPMAQIDAAPPAPDSPPAVAMAVPIADAAPPTLATQPPTVPMHALAAAATQEDSEIAATMSPFNPATMSPTAAVTMQGPPAQQAPAPATGGTPLPAGAQPRLVVLRGLKINTEYPLYEGHNFIGRADEKPVDIDLEDQEPPDRIWSSRQHALITFEDNMLFIEDLNSSNGTFVNRTRVHPGQKRPLQVSDIIQIGTVQMKVKA